MGKIHQLFLQMEQIKEDQWYKANELERTTNKSDRDRLKKDIDRKSAEWIVLNNELNRNSEATKIIEDISKLKDEQLEVGDKLGKETCLIKRKKYDEQLDMMLADIIDLNHKLQRY